MSFGIHFGELVALHRGEQGLSQRQLAINAFDDESRKPRISELERGKVDNPAQDIVDALTVALNLSPEDVSACRTKGRQRTGTLTFEQHEKNVRERVAEAEEKLRAATEADRAALEGQLAEAQKRAVDLEVDFARKQAELDSAHERLDRLHNELGDEKVEAAKKALDEGDTKLADALFGEAEASLAARVEDMNAERAKLAYERGRIAEDDIRWHDADKHYSEAARLAPTYDNLIKAGEFADKCGDYRRSASYEERLVDLAEAEFGAEDERTATALNNLAESYRAQARYNEAEPLYRRALAIGEKTLGLDHPDLAAWLNNLASLLYSTGRYDEAEPFHRRALAIREKALGPDHPGVAQSLNNLALLLQAKGHLDEAEPLHRRALEISEKALGPEHPDVGIRVGNLAGLLIATGRLEEATPLRNRELAIMESAHGPDHPHVAIASNNLAELLHNTGRYDEAEPLFERAVKILRTSLGDDHPRTKKVVANYEAFKAARGEG